MPNQGKTWPALIYEFLSFVKHNSLEQQIQLLKEARVLSRHLFNTLHAVSALVHRNPDAADRMINRLSEMFRLSLESSSSQEKKIRPDFPQKRLRNPRWVASTVSSISPILNGREPIFFSRELSEIRFRINIWFQY